MQTKEINVKEYMQSKEWLKKFKELIISPFGDEVLFNIKKPQFELKITTNKDVVGIFLMREFLHDKNIVVHSDPNDKLDPTFAVFNNKDVLDERGGLVPHFGYQELMHIIEQKIETHIDSIKTSEESKIALWQTFLLNKTSLFERLFTYDFLKVGLSTMDHSYVIENVILGLNQIFEEYKNNLFEIHRDYFTKFQKQEVEMAKNDVLYRTSQSYFVDENNQVHDEWVSDYPAFTIAVDELNSFRFDNKNNQLEQMYLFMKKQKEVYEFLNELNKIRIQESLKAIKDNQDKIDKNEISLKKPIKKSLFKKKSNQKDDQEKPKPKEEENNE